MEVTVTDMLDARDNRVKRQKELLKKYSKTLICFTMNIAGPEKINPLTEEGFDFGVYSIFAQLEGESITVIYHEEQKIFTGCTAFFVVDKEPLFIKKLCAEIEDSSPVTRLFDIDVIKPDGEKVSRSELGLKPRKCLICENEAMVCGSSRAHTVEELQQKTKELLKSAVRVKKSEKIASLAVRSLLYEVCTTTKPGLVDLNNSGSHKDMDVFTFMNSISVLFPYFRDCALCGINTASLEPTETFKRLRYSGKLAQKDMFAATDGVNTHKGAVFSLGILAAACGRLLFCDVTSDKILEEAAKMVKGIVKELDTCGETAGKNAFIKYGITGIRGQAETGFPAVKNYGLPTLLKGIEKGLSLNDAGCGALLSIICNSQDTNIINRSDLDTANKLIKSVEKVIKENEFPDQETLEELDKLFTEKNVSAGGSADLLSLCFFLYFYTK